MKNLILFLVFLVVSPVWSAVEITLPSGEAVTGELERVDEQYYWVRVVGQTLQIPIKDAVCQGTECPKTAPSIQASGELRIYGSNTIGAELMPRLLSGYANTQNMQVAVRSGDTVEDQFFTFSSDDNRQIDVALHAHGSSTAFKALSDGQADIGMASRPAKASEVQILRDKRGVANVRAAGHEHVLALDGLVIIVAKDNSIDRISLNDLKRIFNGEINNWSQLGQANSPINVYARDNKSGTFDTFKSLVLDGTDLVSTAKRFESNEELSDSVASDSGGIGFTGFAYVRNTKTVALVADCGIVSVASEFSVKTEEYPLSRRLYLYTTGSLPSAAQAVLDYSLSDPAQVLMHQTGFINQDIERRPIANMGERIHHAITADSDPVYQNALKIFANQTSQGERLSVTFRFDRASFALDVKALQDISRIARYLNKIADTIGNKRILLLGFADSIGDFNSNTQLSRKRADTVAIALRPLLTPTLQQRMNILALSESAPVACNTDDSGQAKNRRVEVWIK